MPYNGPVDTAMTSDRTYPAYRALAQSGELAERVVQLDSLLAPCRVCPRDCAVDRWVELGDCATGAEATVASWHPHLGEEPPISGIFGSGTVFLANCNLRCVYCQNHDISQRTRSFRYSTLSTEQLARRFLDLQERGCHNINWVSPSHQAPQLVRALAHAAERGLSIPIVYNTNAYDSVETLQLLDGLIDIYMPDLKYASAEAGERLSDVPDYPSRARAALTEMYRQIGDRWEANGSGVLRRGILIRILVLPNDLAGVRDTFRWIAETLSENLTVSLMAQYHPANTATTNGGYADLARPLSLPEWREATAALEEHLPGNRHLVQGFRGLALR
jgi:putative pyruvate formate lyase activating enzyme